MADPAGRVLVFDTATGQQVGTALRIPPGDTPYAIMPRPDRIVTSSFDGTVLVWDVTDPVRPLRVARFRLSDGSVRPWIFLADAANPNLLAIGDLAETQVWDLTTHTLAYPPLPGDVVAESPDGSTLVTATDTEYRLWDVATGKARGGPINATPTPGFRHVAWFSRDGRLLAIEDTHTNTDQFIGVASRHKLPFAVSNGATGRYPCGFLDDGRFCLVMGETATLWRVGGTTQGPFAIVYGPPTGPAAASFMPDGTTLLAATATDLHAWDTETGAPAAPPPGGPYNYAAPPAFSGDGRLLAAPDHDTVDILNPTTGQRINQIAPGTARAAPAWNPNAPILATATTGGTLTLWNLTDPTRPERVARTTAPGFPPRARGVVSFSPDGNLITLQQEQIAQIGEGTIWLFDARRARLLHKLGDATSGSATFSPDSHTLVATANPGSNVLNDVYFWDTTTGALRAKLHLAINPNAIAFINKGQWIVISYYTQNSSSANPQLGIWDASTLNPIGTPIPIPPPNDGATLTTDQPGSDRLAGGTSDTHGSPVVWNLDPTHWQATACHIAGRNLTRSEWNRYLPGRPYQTTCPQWPTPTQP